MRTAPPDRLVAILAAACAAICEQGADAVRLQDVATRAGVSRALLHYHFSSRAEVLRRAYEHADAEADRLVAVAVATAPGPRERLDALLGTYLLDDEAVRVNWQVALELRRAARFDRELLPVVEASEDGWLAQVASALAACGLRSGVDAGARRLCALVDGLGAQRLLGRLAAADALALLATAIDAELAGLVVVEVSRPGSA